MSDTPTLRVASLQISNVLRLSALDFVWTKEHNILTIGGKNGAGKSSTIHALAVALGGMALCPDEPLKRGESRGFVQVDLTSLIVRREFWRDPLMEQSTLGVIAYGETKSRLIVKNPQGVKQEPAQRLLDTLIGKFAFDPLAFTTMDDKQQAETLRKIVGLDTSTFEEIRAIAYDRRAIYTKQAKDLLVVLQTLPHYEGASDTETSLDALMAEQDIASAKQDAVKNAQAELQVLVNALAVHVASQRAAETAQVDLDLQITDMETRLKELRTKRAANELIIAGMVDVAQMAVQRIDEQTRSVEALTTALPDLTDLRARMHTVEDVNSKVRANKTRRDKLAEVAAAQKAEAQQGAIVQQADDDKAAAIRAVKFPVQGLGLTPNGVTFNGISFKQASTAEQIRASVAIGFALNPDLKLLCVKNGNALDEDSYALLAAAARDAGGYVLMEIVTKDANDVAVFIEDGHNS